MPIYVCELRKMTVDIFRGHFIRKWELLRRADMEEHEPVDEWPQQRHLALAYSKVEKHEGIPASFLYTLTADDMLLGAISMWQQNTDTLSVEVQALPWAADLWFGEIVEWLKTLEAPKREDPYIWALARKEEGMTNKAIFDGWAERYIGMYGEEKYLNMADPYEAMTRHLRRISRK